MKRWDKGGELRITERLSLRVFLFFIYLFILLLLILLLLLLLLISLLLFAVILSTCKHALQKESTIKRSVDDLELFDDQRQKRARTI